MTCARASTEHRQSAKSHDGERQTGRFGDDIDAKGVKSGTRVLSPVGAIRGKREPADAPDVVEVPGIKCGIRVWGQHQPIFCAGRDIR